MIHDSTTWYPFDFMLEEKVNQGDGAKEKQGAESAAIFVSVL
jgi:hypothetical protein